VPRMGVRWVERKVWKILWKMNERNEMNEMNELMMKWGKNILS
jgi:hypothetical protein